MGRLAGRYELQQRLAEGGMAEVWLAVAHGEAGFSRRVAIKQLFARDGDGGAFERMFLDEARITSRLHHAGIVSILDYGVEQGRAFQVLELVDGFDAARLAQWGRAQGKPLPVGLALHVCAVVGHALHFAHAACDDAGAALNIVHRDVSPQNVLLSRAGDVKLSDFGVAFAEGRVEKTVGGVARGKPAYMAPEQAVRGPMDGRTDVFALGCVLHALITGDSALRDENALVDLLAGQELMLDASLPEDVRELVARATRRNKAERFDSAEAMALECARLVGKFHEGEPRTALAAWVQSVAPAKDLTLATPKPVVEPRRRRWPLAVVAGGATLLLLLLSPSPPGERVGVRANTEAPALKPEPEPITESQPQPQPQPPPQPEKPVKAPAPHKKPPTTPPRPANGTLTIGGERFLRGEVFIDGASRGYAPGRFELTTGAHRVEVVTSTGARVTRELSVSAQHTPSAPLTWEE